MTVHYQVTGRTAAEILASVEAGVRSGELPRGTALPPVRDLAAGLGVSPGTVAKAYQGLRQRGVVETAGRNGTRIRSRPALAGDRVGTRLPAPPGAVDLSRGEPDARLLPRLGSHLGRLASQVDRVGNYPDHQAVPELVALARARLATDGVPVGPAHAGAVTITGGALDGIERLLTTYLSPGDRVAVEDPGWANLLDLVAALGLVAVGMELDDEGPTGSGLRRVLSAGARAVIITTRAQNPTGAAVTAARASELRAILATAAEVLLIEDDHAAELSTVQLYPLAGATEHWAFLRSTSKPYGPDLRVAVMAGDEATVARAAGRMRVGSGWVSTLLQLLVVELWQDDSVAAAVASARESYQQRRTALCEALRRHGLVAHGRSGINVWVPVPDETRAVTALREDGYAVAPGSGFRLASRPGLRITVSPLELSAVDNLSAAVARAVSARPARAFTG